MTADIDEESTPQPRRAVYSGYRDPPSGRYGERIPAGSPRNSWMRPDVLWRSRNDRIASWVTDPVNDMRRAWVERRKSTVGPPENWVIDLTEPQDVSFLLIGDPGEGDHSQYAVAEALLARADGTNFLLIASDVVYPAGELGDYERKFTIPYDRYKPPIVAVPGNHDWYDSLQGFMFNFCREEPPPPPARLGLARRLNPRRALGRKLWWDVPAPPPGDLRAQRERRRSASPPQPGPYFCIDTKHLRIVAIDTGITNELDHEQAEWLRLVSSERHDTAKILVTGKPLYADGKPTPTTIEKHRPWERQKTILPVVEDSAHNYVAVFGGDIHNYQRYPRRHGKRTINYVVCGGSGAFMHATHKIANLDRTEICSEDDFRCYPLRGDSLAFYSRLYDDRFGALAQRSLALEPEVAARLIANDIGYEPAGATAREIEPTADDRATFHRVARLPAGKTFQRYYSEFLDRDRPPFAKSFLRLDVRDDRLLVTTYAVTGWPEDETDPPVADRFEIDLSNGSWSDLRPPAT
jgi:hypothetical protein